MSRRGRRLSPSASFGALFRPDLKLRRYPDALSRSLNALAYVNVSEHGSRYGDVTDADQRGDFIKINPVSRTLPQCGVGDAIVQAYRERRRGYG